MLLKYSYLVSATNMRKEALIAIIFGITLGLIITFGIIRVNSAIKTNNGSTTNSASENETSNSDGIAENQELTLLKPENGRVYGSDEIDISGVYSTESYIIATGGVYDTFVKTDTGGAFNFIYEIYPSINEVHIDAISPTGNRSRAKVEVVYSSEAIPSRNEDDKEDSDDLSEKVETKLDEAQSVVKYYIGIITDLTESGLQLKSVEGEILQVSYDKDLTTYANLNKKGAKIASSDLAIGDYIISMGIINNGSLMNATRILVTQPQTTENILVFYGTVSEKSKTDMVVQQKNGDNTLITIDNNSVTYEGDLINPTRSRFANISDGDEVIGTYSIVKDENVARRIHILGTGEEE